MRRDSSAQLPIFAYGTLKQGFRNHAAYCQGALEVHSAETLGQLYIWQQGVPILRVPDEQILLSGTHEPAEDLRQEAALRAGEDWKPSLPRLGMRRWRKIQGELIIFPEPEARLKLLDAFEGFRPRPRHESYERVLVPVRLHASRWSSKRIDAAWCYVLPPFADVPDVAVDSDSWTPGLHE